MEKANLQTTWHGVQATLVGETAMNNYFLLNAWTVTRFIKFISLCIVFRTLHQGDSLHQIGSLVSLGNIILYGLLINISFAWGQLQKLIVLDSRFITIFAIIDIVVIVIAQITLIESEFSLLLVLLFPIYVIIRMHRTKLRYLILFVAGFLVLSTYLINVIGDPSLGTVWYTNLPFNVLFLLVAAAYIWRHMSRVQDSIVKSNISYALDVLAKKSGAELIFFRLLANYRGRPVLFLLATSPSDEFGRLFRPDIVARDVNSDSLVTQAFKQQRTIYARTQNDLKKYLSYRHIISRFDLSSGLALPLPNYLGAIAFYWQSPQNTQAIQFSLEPLIRYLDQERIAIKHGIEATSIERLDPMEDWSSMTNLGRKLFEDTELWSSATKLAEGITNISGASSAGVLFFDENKREFTGNH